MQENKPCCRKKTICINVEKVYDWLVKENSFDFSVPMGNYIFSPEPPPNTDFTHAVVTCEVKPAIQSPILILSRESRTISIDGKNVMLQQLNIRKYFVVTLVITLPNGERYTSTTPSVTNSALAFSRCEQVIMCAPEETTVAFTYSNLDCFVCTRGVIERASLGGIDIEGLIFTISTCQSIQSTFPVTVEFLADYCEPRIDLPATSCSTPFRPQQCSVVSSDSCHRCH